MVITNTIPEYTNITDIYYATDVAYHRYNVLGEKFKACYGQWPTFYARAPGRVNLIGEHIDYSGYAVLPMAIEQDIVIAAATPIHRSHDMKDVIMLANTDPRYEKRTLPLDVRHVIDNKHHEWSNYFMAGVLGVLEECKLSQSIPMDYMVDGTVPSGSGVSSSSALVVCASIATLTANDLALDRNTLASLAQRSERYVGVEGGGMDQAISLLAERGMAKLIEFNPLRTHDVRLPEGCVFVISNSLVEANKYVTAGTNYNMRVVECRLASKVIAKKLGLECRSIRKLCQLQNALGSPSLSDMLALVEKHLHVVPYSKTELASLLELSSEQLITECMSDSTASQESFELYRRAMHVFSESMRVHAFNDACQKNLDDRGSMLRLGALMNESHASCRDDFSCSCPELDELTELCLRSGALGSRLTGAGWGGCVVSLVRSEDVGTFIAGVESGYYTCNEKRKIHGATSLFSTQPGSSACVIRLPGIH